tara:strand:+ start:831 stop:1367 length:537 start_codon:yes stop_codon:yes gene_type:complete
MHPTMNEEDLKMVRERMNRKKEEKNITLQEREIVEAKDGRYEIYVKSPFFKTLSGVAFIALAGMAIYGKIKGLNANSWLRIFVNTAIIGILLRFIIYEWSPFNMKKVTSVENLGDAQRLKQNLDKTKKETNQLIEPFQFTGEKTHQIYDKKKEEYVTSNRNANIIQNFLLADILMMLS